MSSKLAGLNVRNNLKANVQLDNTGNVKTEGKKKISFKDSLFTKASITAIYQLIHDEIVEVVPPDILFFGRNYQMLRSFLIIRKLSIYSLCNIERNNDAKAPTYSEEEWRSFSRLQMHLKSYYNIK